MKAIQVLKNCLKYSDYGNDIEEKEYIRKAIAELEVIQDIILEKDEALDIERLLFKNKLEALENKSCENCKYKLQNECSANFLIVCKRHPRLPDHYEESK